MKLSSRRQPSLFTQSMLVTETGPWNSRQNSGSTHVRSENTMIEGQLQNRVKKNSDKKQKVADYRKELADLRKAIRAERRRGIAAHWSYDLRRHLDLVKTYKSKLLMLKQIISEQLLISETTKSE